MATKKQRPNTESSLSGWSEVIRQQGDDMAEREKFRRQQAQQILEAAAKLPLEGRMIVLFTSVEAHLLSNREFFEAAHQALGMPPWSDDEPLVRRIETS